MELPLIHETFQSWAQSLNEQGLSARFAHDLASPEDDLVLSALLLTAPLATPLSDVVNLINKRNVFRWYPEGNS